MTAALFIDRVVHMFSRASRNLLIELRTVAAAVVL